MQVTVKFFSFFCQIVGTDRLSVDLADGALVSELLDSLCNQFDNPLLKNEQVVILVNQKHASLQTILNENDHVLLLPVLGGG
jgi:molybdopterin converting factor small subunit